MLLAGFVWTCREEKRLDARFASGVNLDTTTAKIAFVPPRWFHRKRWYAQYKTADGREIKARFWPRYEYPRNPNDNEIITIVYLKDEVKQCRWLYEKEKK